MAKSIRKKEATVPPAFHTIRAEFEPLREVMGLIRHSLSHDGASVPRRSDGVLTPSSQSGSCENPLHGENQCRVS